MNRTLVLQEMREGERERGTIALCYTCRFLFYYIGALTLADVRNQVQVV